MKAKRFGLAFFASVEQREHREWKGQLVIVGGKPNQRGVGSTCSIFFAFSMKFVVR